MSSFLQRFIDTLLGKKAPDTDERRNLIRLQSRYKVVCAVGAKKHSATVVDMSMSGMSLELAESLVVGKAVQVTYSGPRKNFQFDTVRCEVVWCRKSRYLKHFRVGVRYADIIENMLGSWVKYVLVKELGLSEESSLQRRKSVRVKTSLPLCIRNSDGKKVLEGTTASLSQGGATFVTDVAIKRGTDLLAEIGPYGNFQTLVIHGHIVDYRKTQAGYTHRLTFAETDKEAQKLLGTYLRLLTRDTWQ